MTFVKLSSVATVESGSGFPLVHQGSQGEEFPFLKVSDMNLIGNEKQIQSWNNSISETTRASLRARVFPPNSVIFPKIGAAIATNKKRKIVIPSCVDNNVMGIIPKVDLLLSDYLYYLLLNKNISDFASSANPPSIRKGDVEDWLVYVPSIDEQMNIVSILSEADRIIALRLKITKKVEALKSAIFFKYFGDLTGDQCPFPKVLLSEVCVMTRQGIQAGDRVDLKYLGLENIESMTGKYIEATEEKADVNSSTMYFNSEFVLYSKLRPYLNKVFLPTFEGKCTSELVPLLPGENITREFLANFLRTKSVVDSLMARNTGARMPRADTNVLMNLMFGLPPLDLQSKFSKSIEAISNIQSLHEESLNQSKQYFDLLMTKFVKSK